MKNNIFSRILIVLLFLSAFDAKALIHMTAHISGIPVIVNSKAGHPPAADKVVIPAVVSNIRNNSRAPINIPYFRRPAIMQKAPSVKWNPINTTTQLAVHTRPVQMQVPITVAKKPVVAVVVKKAHQPYKYAATMKVPVIAVPVRKQAVIYTAIATRKSAAKKAAGVFSFAANVQARKVTNAATMTYLFGGLEIPKSGIAAKLSRKSILSAKWKNNKRLAAIPRVPVRVVAKQFSTIPVSGKSIAVNYKPAMKHLVANRATINKRKTATDNVVIAARVSRKELMPAAEYERAVSQAIRAAAMLTAIRNMPVILIAGNDHAFTAPDNEIAKDAIAIAMNRSSMIAQNWTDPANEYDMMK
jgi:hypothetical protein